MVQGRQDTTDKAEHIDSHLGTYLTELSIQESWPILLLSCCGMTWPDVVLVERMSSCLFMHMFAFMTFMFRRLSRQEKKMVLRPPSRLVQEQEDKVLNCMDALSWG